MGFARKVFYDLWGERVSGIRDTITNQEVKPGDYVDLSTDESPHYGIVTKVIDSNSFETLECNVFGDLCKIITRICQKSEVEGIIRATKAR